MGKTIHFTKEKDTKNTVRFMEDPEPGSPPIIGTLYLQKWFIKDRAEVTLTIHDLEERA